MAKTNIIFNNKNYQIDSASLDSATAALRTHLSTVMNGSGETVNLGGTAYNIDATKLATARNAFVSHLGTIAGSGSKVVVDGVEYGIDSAKVQNAISELEATFSGGSTPDTPTEERLEGDGGEYYTLAPTALSFRSTEPLNEFQEVKVNGEVVDPSNYTLEEGSTIVKLSIDYLKTLDVGNYDIDVVSEKNTVSGGFKVAAPVLNEHGFYYNQPYVAYVQGYGNVALCYRKNGILDFIMIDTNYAETATYTVSGSSIINNVSMGAIPSTIVDSCNIQCDALYTTFILGNESIISDEIYFYIYNEALGGYEVAAIDRTKSEYGAIKTGINGIDTIGIRRESFAGCGNLTSIVIPDSVINIGEIAFMDCSALTSVTIPDSVIAIEQGAFIRCSTLTSINIPDGVTNIEYSVFKDCTRLANITIPDGVTNIGEQAFKNCTSLTNIAIPNSVTAIGFEAFWGSGITSITIPNSVTTIEYNAFQYCNNLKSVVIENGVKMVGGYMFFGCSNLTSITFNGTTAQWNSITKEEQWNYNVPATFVQCSDGQVAL